MIFCTHIRISAFLIFLSLFWLGASPDEGITRKPVVLRLHQIAQTATSPRIVAEFPREQAPSPDFKKRFLQKLEQPTYIPRHFVKEDEPSTDSTAGAEVQSLSSFQFFRGINDTGGRPADPILAAGPDHLIAAVNSSIAIFTKDGSKIFQTTFASWFSSLPESHGSGLFDPRVIYDQYSGHFIFLCAAARSSDHRSWYLFSVSKTSDASGEWAFWTLDMQLNNNKRINVFADFPGLGFDADAIYVTGNIFNLTPFHYSYAKIRVLKKSEVYAFGALTWHDFWNFRDATGSKAINVEPVQNFGPVTLEYLVSSNAKHGDKLTLWSITDPASAPVLHKQAVLVSSYRLPPNAPQKGGSILINTGDAGLTNAVLINGNIYAANSVSYDWGSGLVAAVRFYELDTAGNVLQEITFGSGNYFYYYPVVTADSHNNVAIAFNRSGTTGFAGIYFTERKPTDPSGFLHNSLRIKAGRSYYDEPNGNGVDLWGDYNGIALDSDDSIWIFSMFAKSLHQWGTRGAKFHF